VRAVNRVVAGVLAAALAAAGVLTLIEMIEAALGHPPAVVDWPAWVAAMARNTWSDAGPRIVGGVLAMVGLVLVFLGLWPGTPERFVLVGSSPRTATFVSRRAIVRVLRGTALAVDGVTRAAVRVRRRQVTVRLRVRPRTAADAPTRARSALAARLDGFQLARPPALRVTARSARPRRRADGVVPEPPATGAATGAPAGVASAAAGPAAPEPGAGGGKGAGG
jgi:hypothetical protein